MPLQTLWWLHGHRNNSLPLKAEMTFEALPHCCLLTAQWASRSSLPAFLKHTRYVLPPGLCTCCFHHLEDSSSMVGCLTSFRFLCKIIFSEAFPWWPWLLPWVSGSEHRLLPPLSPTAWCLLDLIDPGHLTSWLSAVGQVIYHQCSQFAQYKGEWILPDRTGRLLCNVSNVCRVLSSVLGK